MTRLLVVEHEADAPAGLLDGWAAGRGLTVATVRLHAGDQLPPTAGAGDAAVILGSEQTAYDDAVPWLARELAFVARLLTVGVPVLGICFGAQVLARVLGARLYRLAEPEIGWVRVTSQRPGLPEGPWPSWHRDAFDLPAGATALAVNEVCLQGFTIGPHAGVQFHPEATEAIVADWLAHTDPPPRREVTDPFFAGAGRAWERGSVNAHAFFSGWLDGDLASYRPAMQDPGYARPSAPAGG
jgi:GMP synthase-like glutamine amidotransferase